MASFLRGQRLLIAVGLIGIASWLVAEGTAAGPITVATYHYNDLRTGWNKQETTPERRSISGEFRCIKHGGSR